MLFRSEDSKPSTSDEQGQIYIGAVNWSLMVGVILLVLGFESSGALASAYVRCRARRFGFGGAKHYQRFVAGDSGIAPGYRTGAG